LLLLASCEKNITNGDNSPAGDTFLLDKASIYYETDSAMTPGLTQYYTYVFDNDGRVIEKLESDSNDTYTTRYTYKYGENSLLKEATLQRIKYPVEYYYKFNYSNNRLVNVEIRQDRTINYVNYYYTYDGDDTTEWTIQQTIPDTILYSMRPFCWKYVYHRLSDGRRLEIKDGWATIYTYNSDNKLTKRTFYSGDTLSPVSYTLEYTYDDNGNVSEEIYTFTKKRVTKYTYKNYGKVKSAPMFFMVSF
jgi:hypothetical protein